MSRSYRKSPFHGNCADSDKADKVAANRRLRRAVRANLRDYDDDADVLPELRGVSDVWDFAKDGKSRYDEDYVHLNRK